MFLGNGENVILNVKIFLNVSIILGRSNSLIILY